MNLLYLKEIHIIRHFHFQGGGIGSHMQDLGLTSGSVFQDYSWSCLGDHKSYVVLGIELGLAELSPIPAILSLSCPFSFSLLHNVQKRKMKSLYTAMTFP